jgi:hypothetical protein
VWYWCWYLIWRWWNTVGDVQRHRVLIVSTLSALGISIWGCFGRSQPSTISLLLWSALFGSAFAVLVEIDDLRRDDHASPRKAVGASRKLRVIAMPHRGR